MARTGQVCPRTAALGWPVGQNCNDAVTAVDRPDLQLILRELNKLGLSRFSGASALFRSLGHRRCWWCVVVRSAAMVVLCIKTCLPRTLGAAQSNRKENVYLHHAPHTPGNNNSHNNANQRNPEPIQPFL